MDPETVQRAYSSVAGLYIDLFGTRERTHPDDLAFIGRHLKDCPGPVLDLGCGPGHLTAYLRSLGVDASGIDLVPEFVAHARAAHPDGHYRIGSMTRLDAAGGSVAGILAWFSLIHLPPDEIDDVLAEFRRVLAPGGSLVVGMFDGDEVAAFEHKVVTAYRWSPAALSQRLSHAGFAEVDRLHRPSDGTHRPYAAVAARG
ncbi:hypothetical protein Val02_05370 [Virgisporangium aliadipatigenens]|uniref:Methyltransferase domain-containing protein n=1 Tax=Virgisporangium aliadipatigenens TaxID=741659 RepID=A0A8J3YEQ3_9ACTN|nr:class I SAM-dependent methyltransferase [Virgisporangium aliadipatigenens]GIJ43651.1 hypothetical protein Val02_05370 [Virgisporangium aliadipatigenens]